MEGNKELKEKLQAEAETAKQRFTQLATEKKRKQEEEEARQKAAEEAANKK